MLANISNTVMDAACSDAIARSFLPGRWHYYYTRPKLRSDPLYGGAAAALAGSDPPDVALMP